MVNLIGWGSDCCECYIEFDADKRKAEQPDFAHAVVTCGLHRGSTGQTFLDAVRAHNQTFIITNYNYNEDDYSSAKRKQEREETLTVREQTAVDEFNRCQSDKRAEKTRIIRDLPPKEITDQTEYDRIHKRR